jgi:hypothetical protein
VVRIIGLHQGSLAMKTCKEGIPRRTYPIIQQKRLPLRLSDAALTRLRQHKQHKVRAYKLLGCSPAEGLQQLADADRQITNSANSTGCLCLTTNAGGSSLQKHQEPAPTPSHRASREGQRCAVPHLGTLQTELFIVSTVFHAQHDAAELLTCTLVP